LHTVCAVFPVDTLPFLAAQRLSLLQCLHQMADWKQITARIRRARGSRDPAGQLTLLYEKTGDAMVAFELGRHFEIAKDRAQALEWYLTSATKFRRGEWKTKARDAVIRLGGELPADPDATPDFAPSASAGASVDALSAIAIPDPAVPLETARGTENPSFPESAPTETSAESEKKHRRRGRRGGRHRRKAGPAPASSDSRVAAKPGAHARAVQPFFEAEPAEILPPRVVDSRAIPRLPVEPLPDTAVPGVKSRFGDPGLASRLSLLEMQLRRLLTCPAAKLHESAHAPAGPGVFVLTDDDMTTYYYVEACDTLRIAIGNLARSGMTRRGNTNLKSLLADHLGIPETRVSKYLSEHCVVRWLQLDEGSTNFQHFAIAVLRPTLNE